MCRLPLAPGIRSRLKLLFVAVTALVLYDRRRRSRAVRGGPDASAAPRRNAASITLSALAVAASVLAITTVVQSGHTGASATWDRISQQQPQR